MVSAFSFQNDVYEDEPDEPCYGKRCTSNEYCCPGSVCVNVDGGKTKYFCISDRNNHTHIPIPHPLYHYVLFLRIKHLHVKYIHVWEWVNEMRFGKTYGFASFAMHAAAGGGCSLN